MPISIQFVPVNLRNHRSQLIELNVEYLNWVVKVIDDYYQIDLSADLEISVQEYVANNIESICSVPPHGIFYLLKLEEAVIGMGGLRKVR